VALSTGLQLSAHEGSILRRTEQGYCYVREVYIGDSWAAYASVRLTVDKREGELYRERFVYHALLSACID
jgi:hypothetical protein